MPPHFSAVAYTWGSTARERAMPFPCDDLLPAANEAYFRAVTVHASVPIVFRWLCQLRIAPYSYDWIDNLGRRSPRRLTAGLEQLEVDQRVMRIFRIAAFEKDRHITLTLAPRRALAVSYVVLPVDARRCRLIAKMVVHYPGRDRWSPMRSLFAWSDLVMTRRQLLNLKALAERQALNATG